MQRREVVLDPDGMPLIQATRDDEGQMGFYILNRYTGGRLQLDPVKDDILRSLDRPKEGSVRKLNEQIRQVQARVAATIAEGDEGRARRLEELEAQAADLSTELEESSARIAALEHELEEAQAAKANTRRKATA